VAPEVRLAVYSYLFEDVPSLRRPSTFTRSGRMVKQARGTQDERSNVNSILLVCRILYNEASSMFYVSTKFIFDIMATFRSECQQDSVRSYRSLNTSALRTIKQVTIQSAVDPKLVDPSILLPSLQSFVIHMAFTSCDGTMAVDQQGRGAFTYDLADVVDNKSMDARTMLHIQMRLRCFQSY
jgi:hypothetical protein